MSLSRRAGLGILAAAVVLVVAVTAVVVVIQRQSSGGQAKQAVEGYLDDWSAGRYDQMAVVADQPVDSFTAFYRASATGLEEQEAKYELLSVSTGDAPSATFRATITPANYPDWTYEGTLPLAKRNGDWHVAWSPAALHPSLQAGQHLALVRAQAAVRARA